MMLQPIVYARSVLNDHVEGKMDEYTVPSDARGIAKKYLSLCEWFKTLGGNFNGGPSVLPFFDRTDHLPNFVEIRNRSPMTTNWDLNMAYTDIVAMQAVRIMALGKRIVVYWSGGTDSTMIVCALLAAGIKKDQLFLVLNNDSIKEYEWFYTNVIVKQGIPHWVGYASQLSHTFEDYNDQDIVMTGHLAEAVLHPGRISLMMTDRDYRTVIPQDVIEFTLPLVLAAPKRIWGIYDFCWWIRFCMYWQAFKFHPISYLPRKPFAIISFWDSPEFESWSLHNNKPQWHRVYSDPMDYKADNKDVIVSYTGDHDYRYKVRATTLRFRQPPWSYILEDLTLVGAGTDILVPAT